MSKQADYKEAEAKHELITKVVAAFLEPDNEESKVKIVFKWAYKDGSAYRFNMDLFGTDKTYNDRRGCERLGESLANVIQNDLPELLLRAVDESRIRLHKLRAEAQDEAIEFIKSMGAAEAQKEGVQCQQH